MLRKKKILVAPLDWGLGHATRCIPIIQKLLELDCTVVIAAEGATQSILSQAFPSLSFLPLQGYSVKYSREKNRLIFKILWQLPKIITVIIKENRWLKNIVKTQQIDAIISDNRFGLNHSTVPCVYITHQLAIQTGFKISDKLAQFIHAYFIKKYTYCWVPDFKETENFAGKLSHPKSVPLNVFYIGGLSRFVQIRNLKKLYDIVIIISGPEPQRSIFEKLLLNQLKNFVGNVLLIRGLPGNNTAIPIALHKGLEVHSHLSATELNRVILQAQIVICRSGYTSVMDLVKLQQKTIMVATPGQTEQGYLANYLAEKKIFYSVPQEEFDLQKALAVAADFPYRFPVVDMEQYKKQVEQFVSNL